MMQPQPPAVPPAVPVPPAPPAQPQPVVPQPPQQPAAAPAPFALTPATVNNDVLDYSTTAGQRLFNSAVSSLDENNPYDCTPAGLHGFLNLVRDRARNNGWTYSVLSIPRNIQQPLGQSDEFLDHHGEITIEHLTHHSATYVHQHNRAAQDSVQLYTCLMNSLSTEGRNKVNLYRKEFISQEVGVGVLLLKVIIRESHVDTQSTKSHLREQLMATSLTPYLLSIGSNITKFNEHVMELRDQLAQRGATTTDLLENLFIAYEAVTDTRFMDYMAIKRNSHDDDTAPLTADQLMMLAKNKYEALVTKKQWNVPNDQEQKILALQTQIKELKTQQKGKAQPQKQKPKGKWDRKPARKQNMEWLNLKPPEGKPDQPIEQDGKLWYFCTKHQRRCLHKTSECEGKGLDKPANQGKNASKSGKQRKQGKQRAQLVRALQALPEEDALTDEE
jgi:hypothetical protein